VTKSQRQRTTSHASNMHSWSKKIATHADLENPQRHDRCECKEAGWQAHEGSDTTSPCRNLTDENRTKTQLHTNRNTHSNESHHQPARTHEPMSARRGMRRAPSTANPRSALTPVRASSSSSISSSSSARSSGVSHLRAGPGTAASAGTLSLVYGVSFRVGEKRCVLRSFCCVV
jgi:hypothetical protein